MSSNLAFALSSPLPAARPLEARPRAQRWSWATLAALAWSVNGSQAAASSPPNTDAGAHANCHVRLNRVSYDDPGGDDAEFVELYVVGNELGPRFTLGQCGVRELWLVNGGGTECEPYRKLDMAEVVADPRGFVVLCSAESSLHQDIVCDVTANLPNGWLQNGPDDGIWLIGPAGEEGGGDARYSYAVEAGTCAANATVLPAEAPVAVDDVSVWCGDAYARLELSDSPLRSTSCSPPVVDGGSDAGVTPDASAIGQPPLAESNGAVVEQDGTFEPLPWDAGAPTPAVSTDPPQSSPAPPPIGCALTRTTHPCPWPLVAWIGWMRRRSAGRRSGLSSCGHVHRSRLRRAQRR